MDAPVDYRYLLANERTFLAYVRTALSLQVAGLGVLQFLTNGSGVVRYTLGVLLVLGGCYVGLTGVIRYRSNDRAIRANTEMPTGRVPVLVTAAVVVLPVVAAVVIVASAM